MKLPIHTFITTICILLLGCPTAAQDTEQKVMIETPHGNITVKLYNETPQHRDNFIELARKGFYDSTLFHRVIDGFMIQGGDPDSKSARPGQKLGDGGPGYIVEAELSDTLYHKRGALAAARKGDQINPKKESSGSQFYLVQGKVYDKEQLRKMDESLKAKHYNTAITRYLRKPENDSVLKEYERYVQNGEKDKAAELWNSLKAKVADEGVNPGLTEKQIELYSTVGGTPHLDKGYTVFGEVVEGMEVVDRIARERTDRNNRPVKDIWMKVRLLD